MLTGPRSGSKGWHLHLLLTRELSHLDPGSGTSYTDQNNLVIPVQLLKTCRKAGAGASWRECHPSLVSHVGSEESACLRLGLGSSRTRRESKVPAHPRAEDGAWLTFEDTTTPSPSSGRRVCGTARLVTENQNSVGPSQNSTPVLPAFTKGLTPTERGRTKIFKTSEAERRKPNLLFKGGIQLCKAERFLLYTVFAGKNK